MKQVMITGVLVFLVLALFSCTTILPAHSNDPAIASGMSESPLFPTEDEFSAAEEIPTEPPAWTHIFMENYAIYKILGKTDETIQFPTWDGIIWQKYGCEIVYMFPEEDYWQEPQPGDVDETGLGFGEQHNDEIWIPENARIEAEVGYGAEIIQIPLTDEKVVISGFTRSVAALEVTVPASFVTWQRYI